MLLHQKLIYPCPFCDKECLEVLDGNLSIEKYNVAKGFSVI